MSYNPWQAALSYTLFQYIQPTNQPTKQSTKQATNQSTHQSIHLKNNILIK